MRWFSRRRIARLLLALGLLLGAAYGALELYDSHTLQSEVPRLAAALELRPGSVIGEVGAGQGKMTIRVARHVGPEGHVFSTELDPERVVGIRRAAAKARLDNVTVVKGGTQDTNLPVQCCDAIFMRKVYHHFTNPSPINASLYRALRPGGRLVIIDFSPGTFFWLWGRPEGVPENRAGHGVPQKIVVEEVTRAGFAVARVIKDWPGWQYCMVFRKPMNRPERIGRARRSPPVNLLH